ncbi:MAG TPA: ribonuclease H-like YkuK family protein [Candidatus Saccharimonadales bacterium]|nr:ribonuclease H-like YkuK family protein [Candidatus Saccharimonadales bacterium]
MDEITSDVLTQKFQSITHGTLTVFEVLDFIKAFLKEDPLAQYCLVIGTDSHEKMQTGHPLRHINAVTAVLVRRIGFGGKYFWKQKKLTNIHSLREKIYAETLISLDFASQFVPLLKTHLNGTSAQYNLEIHVDVGEHGATREMIKEVVGMVTGNGYVAKTKPEAYAASYVADRHT